MRLNCGSCLVRDWRASDRDCLLRYANSRNVWRNLSHRFPHPYTPADADAWFARLAEAAEPTAWAIEVEGSAAGGIGIDLGEGIFDRSGRLGYWLGEPWWGRGIMTDAVRATTDHVLATFDVVRVEAFVFEWNPGSMRVLEKCGFTREGVLRRSIHKDGEIIDEVLFSRVRRAGTLP